jgi:hypothetical protein
MHPFTLLWHRCAVGNQTRPEVRARLVYKYEIGETVNFTPASNPRARRGKYRIVRRMPAEGGDNQYRAQCLANGEEWVVRESELS